jgi:adenylate kinase
MKPTTRTHLKDWLGTGSINIFGRPFAGKDTQGRLLAEFFDGTLLGGGEILRGSTMPDHIKAAMKTGKLIPTDDYIAIVLPYLSQVHLTSSPLILSSVGRWHGEEEGVIGATEASGHPLKAVIYLALDEETVRQRWAASHEKSDRGDRHDDTEEILEIRLAEYREKTLAVIDYYRENGLLIEIDGNQPPEKVTLDILKALSARSNS